MYDVHVCVESEEEGERVATALRRHARVDAAYQGVYRAPGDDHCVVARVASREEHQRVLTEASRESGVPQDRP